MEKWGMRLKMKKRKGLLAVVSVVVVILIIFGCYKIKEYNTLKDVFVFSQDDIVAIWRLKENENNYDYDYKLESNEISALSNLLASSKLEKSTINDAPSDALGNMIIFLDGKQIEENGDVSLKFERRIALTPIDKYSVYVILEINKTVEDNKSMESVMQKFYIIDSEKLVAVMNENI